MLILPAIAMTMNIRNYADQHKWLLFGFGFATILIEIWMIVEAISVWKKSKGMLEELDHLPEANDREGGRSC